MVSADPQPPSDSQSRRRRGGDRGRRSKGRTRIENVLQTPGFERWLHIGVGVVAIAYAGLMVQIFHSDTIMLGFRPTGAPRSEVLYGFGRPDVVSNDAEDGVRVTSTTPIDAYDRWQYPADGGGTFRFRFNDAGISDRVSCIHDSADRGSCPTVFGIGIGDTEDHVVYQLGVAPVRTLNGTRAILRYPSIGTEFELEQFEVRRITLSTDRSSIISRIPRFVRYLIP